MDMEFIKKILKGTILIFLILITSLSLNSHSDAFNPKPDKVTDSGESGRQYDNLVKSYDTLIKASMESENIPGMAVAIVKDNRILFLKGYGVKEFGSTDSVDIHTVFRLGSVSKGFASVLAGILVEDKKINWDDNIIKYLPDFRLKDTSYSNHLSIRNVLSQTTGLPVHTYTDMLDYNVPYEQIKPLLAEIAPIAKPGQVYSYQNVAYSLIADVAKSATGNDYVTLVKNKIFIPLNMKDASLDYESMENDSDVAKPHVCIGSKKWKALKLNPRYYSAAPASGVNASISDMAQWLLALTGNYPEFISEKSLEETYTPQIRTLIKRHYRHNWKHLGNLYYGLGWRIFDYAGKKIVYHGGYVKGYRAEIAVDYEEKVGIVVLFNSACRLASTCIPSFWELYLDNTSTIQDEFLASSCEDEDTVQPEDESN